MKVKFTAAKLRALSPKGKPYEIRDTEVPGLRARVETTGNIHFRQDLYTPDGVVPRKRYNWLIGSFPVYTTFSRPSTGNDAERDVRTIAMANLVKAKSVDLREERATAIAIAKAEAAARKQEEQDRAVNTLGHFLDTTFMNYAKRKHKTPAMQTVGSIKSAWKDLLDMPLMDIDHTHINAKLDSMREEGKAETTVHRQGASLGSVLTQAVRTGLIPHHPLQHDRRNNAATLISLPNLKKVARKRVRYLRPAEEKRLRLALQSRDEELKEQRLRFISHCENRRREAPAPITGRFADHLHPLTLVALGTGIRRGGLLSLTWEDIELDVAAGTKRMIHVPSNASKSGYAYSVPMPDEVTEALMAWREQTGDTGLVFPNPNTGDRMKDFRSAWTSLLAKAKINNFRFHDCRHSYGSKLVQGGVDLYRVMELMGHRDISMTQRYAHLAPDHMDDALAVLNSRTAA